jgi:hypothetical protein
MEIEGTCPLKSAAFIGAWVMKHGDKTFYEPVEEGRLNYFDLTDCIKEGCAWYDDELGECAIMRLAKQ